MSNSKASGGIEATLQTWVKEVAGRTKPSRIVECHGSQEEYDSLTKQMLSEGTLIQLNQKEYPNCYLHRSNPNDVARSEDRTFICTRKQDDVGPTNNWIEPSQAKKILWKLLAGCMRNRVMYVIPYLLGPVDSPYSRVGVELTDSPYVAANMMIMTRVGQIAFDHMKSTGHFVKGVHSAGNLDPKNKYICHFPDEKLIISVNSNYGGNALLSKKCHALRIGSVTAREEGWLAEHMFLIGAEDPEGKIAYISGAFPSASGKTNVAMLRPPPGMEGWKIWAISDDITWIHIDPQGTFRAINPEAGFFGVAPNTNMKTNPNIMETIKKNTIFTNVALAADGTPWWEGMGDPPSKLWDWRGKEWMPGGEPAAHPNSRFTTPVSQYPFISPMFDDPNGAPLSAMMFGGRRATQVPLILETENWEQGVLMAVMLKAETTTAADGKAGVVRADPMAMKPFCGYNMADYFTHWLKFRLKSNRPPKIFLFNAFRRNQAGQFLWPGYGQNLRVLKWMIDRCNGRAEAVETPIGYVPTPNSLDLHGLDISPSTLQELLRVDAKEWVRELEASQTLFESFGERFPSLLWKEYSDLMEKLRKQTAF